MRVIRAIGILLIVLAGPVAAQNPEALVLGPLDQIEVNVASYPELKTLTRIAADGTVILPLVGAVKIGGLAPADAANAIETNYVNGGFIKLPTVRVELVDIQSRKVSVLGEVNAQGLLALDRSYSVAEILARAGGLGPEAADSAILIRQPAADTPPLRVMIDLGELVAGSGASALTPVRAGDVVFVPKAPTFSVTGAVSKPGTYRLAKGMTVDQAIAAAGDVGQFGTRSKLRVRRAPATGGATAMLPVALDDRVLAGDIIVVRERLF